MDNFKVNKGKILITTDISSRGLDIRQCELVINYDLPYSPINFVHRAGRTGRLGNKGICLNFVSQYDIELLMTFEDVLKVEFEKMEVDEEEIMVDIGLVSKGIKITKTKLLK